MRFLQNEKVAGSSEEIKRNFLAKKGLSEDEIKEAFLEFYKLLDDYEIINKSSYDNINAWYDSHQDIES